MVLYGLSNVIFQTTLRGVKGLVIVDSTITLNSNSSQTNNLDIVSSNYYNSGYTNLAVNILSTEK
jgi:hypothetical protein